MNFEITTYSSNKTGKEYVAIQLTWAQAEEILGHPHTGAAEEDKRLVEALLAAGAPAWAKDAEGWVDENGWGLIGPGK